MTSVVTRWGISITVTSRSDAALLAMRSISFSFILTYAVIRRKFPIGNAKRVRMSIAMVTSIGTTLMIHISDEGCRCCFRFSHLQEWTCFVLKPSFRRRGKKNWCLLSLISHTVNCAFFNIATQLNLSKCP